MTHSQTQSQQGIDVLAFPIHPRPLQAGLYDELVGAFDHARANGPTLCLEVWVLHQGGSFLEILHVLLDAFLPSQRSREMCSYAQKRRRATMLEYMQATGVTIQ
jgi:hypothetical protein